MKVKLPSSIASLQDLTTLTAEVKDYNRWFIHEATKKQAGAKHASEPPVLSTATLELLRTHEAKQSLDQHSLSEIIEELENYSKTAPSISFTLAATPTKGVKTTLVAWCRENIAPNILVNFQFNSSILGGMVVRCGSHVFDWSFRRQILSEKNKLPEILRRV